MIETTRLPIATSGEGYAASLSASGGTGTITWTLASGQLPAGIALSPSGTLSGTPAAQGNFPLTVEAADAAKPEQTATAKLVLVSQSSALTLTIPKLYPAFQGAVYVAGDAGDANGAGQSGGALVNIAGGAGPYACSVVNSSLPPGMSLAGETPPIYPAGVCAITGTPSTGGDFPMTIEVSDAGGDIAAEDLTFVVMSSSLPQVSEVAAASASDTSEVITWTTNVPASSKVCYEPTNVCTPETDVGGVTSHSVTLTGLVPDLAYSYWVESEGVVNGAPQDYVAVASVPELNTFMTANPPQAGTNTDLGTTMMAYGLGAHQVTAGSPMYVGIVFSPVANGNSAASYQFTVTHLPPQAQVHWPDEQDNGATGYGTVSTTDTTNDTLTSNGGMGGRGATQFDILTNQGGTTPAGSYTLTVSYSVLSYPAKAVEFSGSFTWPMNVEAPQSFTATPPGAYPPIPDLALWQNQMTNAGNIVPNEANWYNGQQNGGACEWDSDDQGVQYYDGAWVYDQIGAYTGNPAHWITGGNASPCPSGDSGAGPQGAAAAMALYHEFLVTQNYSVPGYWVFPHGLYYACKTEGDAQACADLHGLAGSSPAWWLLAGDTNFFDPMLIREKSYALGLARLDYDAGGGSSTLAEIHQLVDYAVAEADEVANGTTAYDQPFMDGLLAQALIEYYMDPKTGNQSDARIPIALEVLAQHLWTADWVPRAGADGMFLYNTWWVDNGSQQFLQTDGDWRNLNLLIAPLYGWLYYETGNVVYQQEGDAIWDSGVTSNADNGIGWSGKNFSQQYRWSFEYVKWRGGTGTFLTPW